MPFLQGETSGIVARERKSSHCFPYPHTLQLQVTNPDGFFMDPLKTELQDAEIISRIVQGDTDSFEMLLDRYRGLVFGVVGRHVPVDRTEDVAQEAFLEVFRSLASFSGKSPFSHWISKISLRCCIDFWRRNRCGLEVPVSSISEDSDRWMDALLATDSLEVFEREASRKEAAEILDFALSRLSPEDRTIVTLVHLDGLSSSDAAALLGWSSVRVKVRAHRSRRKIRSIIEDLLNGRGEEGGA